MKLSVLSLARDDLKEIRMYLSDYGERPPQKFRDSFKKFCIQVVDMPYMFSLCEHNKEYRKAVIIFDYVIFYKVDEDKRKILVYRVLHGKRNMRPLLDSDK